MSIYFVINVIYFISEKKKLVEVHSPNYYFKQGRVLSSFGLIRGFYYILIYLLKVLIKFSYNKFLEVYHSHLSRLL